MLKESVVQLPPFTPPDTQWTKDWVLLDALEVLISRCETPRLAIMMDSLLEARRAMVNELDKK